MRPAVNLQDIHFRGAHLERPLLGKIKNGLLTLHTLELMAMTVYRFQITKAKTEHNRQLIAAQLNESSHYQDFQLKLSEYGWRPFVLRVAFWCVGFALGLSSRLLGKRAILKTGIWVETKAIEHYNHLLKTIAWDDESRKIIEKDQFDEFQHIKRWQSFLF